MAGASEPLTAAELKEIEELNRENEVLANEISNLAANMTEETEKRKKSFLEDEGEESHQSRAYLREIKSLRKNSPIVELIQQWRTARLHCASYSETIEEVRNNFIEMKNLYGQLQSREAQKP